MIDEGQPQTQSISDHIQAQAERLSRQLNAHMFSTFSPDHQKSLRKFSAAEASEFIGTSPSNLRKLHSEGKIPDVEQDARGRRNYAIEEIDAIRDYLSREGRNADNFRPGRRSENDAMKVVCVSNFKGGSLKTSSTIAFATRFSLLGYRVLAIDMDAQASLTTMFGYRPEIAFSEGGTIYDVLTYSDPVPLSSVIRKTYIPKLDFVPSGIMLSEYETETALALSSKDTSNGRSDVPFYNRLSQALATVKDDYDIVFIDCPPQIGFLTLTALMSATGVITPIIPAMYDVASMAQFLQLTANLMKAIEGQNITTNWDFMKFMISRYEPQDGPQNQMVGFLRMIFGDDVMTHPVLKSTVVLDAANTQQTIYEIDPATVNMKTLDRALTSMNAAAQELHDMIQKSWGRNVPVRGEI
jgi:chromosome partitioning protein